MKLDGDELREADPKSSSWREHIILSWYGMVSPRRFGISYWWIKEVTWSFYAQSMHAIMLVDIIDHYRALPTMATSWRCKAHSGSLMEMAWHGNSVEVAPTPNSFIFLFFVFIITIYQCDNDNENIIL